MSGQLLISSKHLPDQSHLRARIELQKTAGLAGKKSASDEIRFIDQRTFGWLSIEQIQDQIPTSVAHIAYDPFEADFNLKEVITNISSRKSAIKPAILNQEIISGIGNIYADEALWRAKIHPEIICEDLSEDEIKKLINSAKAVMKSAIKAGGTSFDQQYKNVNGASGYFSRSLSVYGRAGQPCSRCSTLIRRIAFANRSSHFCPRCQR
jgi:formamidopyrimidine-DNA glycosylase